MQFRTKLLSSAYFPPVIFFSEIAHSQKNILDISENYEKQSYRNRCRILGSNGVQALSVPVKKFSSGKTCIKDIRVDYSQDWQTVHRRAIAAAYSKSPFYEFYIHAFEPFFSREYEFLWDLNLDIIQTVFAELEEQMNLKIDSFDANIDENYTDLRHIIHPKKEQHSPTLHANRPYTQVFFDRFDFIPNLSILDLLFNKGSETFLYL